MWKGVLALVYYVFVVSLVSFSVFKHDMSAPMALVVFSVIIYGTAKMRSTLLFSLSSEMNWVAYRGLPLWIFQCTAFKETNEVSTFLYWSLGAAVVVGLLEFAIPVHSPRPIPDPVPVPVPVQEPVNNRSKQKKTRRNKK